MQKNLYFNFLHLGIKKRKAEVFTDLKCAKTITKKLYHKKVICQTLLQQK
jgi:hypothetical protein